jgi:hypothetical protein
MFRVIRLRDRAPDSIEQLGTKPKAWFHDKQLLFKEVRKGTGDDWSEKVASELCALLGLPHAIYELATWRGVRGVVTPTFVPRDGRLVLGNELLAKLIRGYPAKRLYRVREHTVRVVTTIVKHPAVGLPIGFRGFAGVDSAIDVFVGYLMLDAWIANQDRHHENWGLVVTPQGTIHLTPSFDHASSLGTNETEKNRSERLTTRNHGRSMERYVERARSAMFASPSSRKPLSTLEAFRAAAGMRPLAARAWLDRMEQVSLHNTRSVLESVPEDRISAVAIEFAEQMLELNYHRLLALRDV